VAELMNGDKHGQQDDVRDQDLEKGRHVSITFACTLLLYQRLESSPSPLTKALSTSDHSEVSI
jgi:hypothetical protein